MDMHQYRDQARQDTEANATRQLEAQWVAKGGQPGTMPSVVPVADPNIDPVGRELVATLGRFDIVPGGAEQLAKLWRDDFSEVNGAVQTKDGKSPGEVIQARLTSAEFANFSPTGGPKNLGQAIILQIRQREHEARLKAAQTTGTDQPLNLGQALANVYREQQAARQALDPAGLSVPRGFGAIK